MLAAGGTSSLTRPSREIVLDDLHLFGTEASLCSIEHAAQRLPDDVRVPAMRSDAPPAVLRGSNDPLRVAFDVILEPVQAPPPRRLESAAGQQRR